MVKLSHFCDPKQNVTVTLNIRKLEQGFLELLASYRRSFTLKVLKSESFQASELSYGLVYNMWSPVLEPTEGSIQLSYAASICFSFFLIIIYFPCFCKHVTAGIINNNISDLTIINTLSFSFRVHSSVYQLSFHHSCFIVQLVHIINTDDLQAILQFGHGGILSVF